MSLKKGKEDAMQIKSIGIVIVAIFTFCWSHSFAQCPPEFPADCGDMWCCTDSIYCPEEGSIWERDQCTLKIICPFATIFGEASEEVEILRYVRDSVLSQTPEGREIIKLYYQWSPAIIKTMEEDEKFKEEVKELIDGILPLIRGQVE